MSYEVYIELNWPIDVVLFREIWYMWPSITEWSVSFIRVGERCISLN